MTLPADPSPQSDADVAVLVVSWDGCADLWDPFFECLFHFWPDCPYPVYLGANSLTVDRDGVKPLLIGREVDYCSNLIAMLGQLEQRWVITWVEDFFPVARIDTGRIEAIVKHAEQHGVDYANLVALPFEITPLFAGPPVVDSLGELPEDAPYRASMGAGLWRRESLLRLLTPGETAWDLERAGAQRSAELKFRCLCTTSSRSSDPPIVVVNGIERGRWTRKAADFLRSRGLGKVVEERGVEDALGVWKMFAYSVARYSVVRMACAVGGASARRFLASLIAHRRVAWLN